MIFYNPALDSVSVSADYHLDNNRHIEEVFSEFRYDGGLTTSVLSDRKGTPTSFAAGDDVHVQLEGDDDVRPGRVTTPPTALTDLYSVELEDGSTIGLFCASSDSALSAAVETS